MFDPMVSTSILEHIFEGVNGDSVYRGASFLAGKLGQKIAGDNVNIIDDGTIAGGFGTSPFDGEGVPTRRTVVIENGVLKSYLLNTYTAKKLEPSNYGQRLSRAGRNARHRPRQLFSAARHANSERVDRRNQGRPSTLRNFSAMARTW